MKQTSEMCIRDRTYTEAIELLEKNNDKFDYKVSWGCDLQTEHERFLTEQVFKRPVFVTDYPKEIKAFYMKLNEDGKTVAAVDCLVPGIGEIIGGSQRDVYKRHVLWHAVITVGIYGRQCEKGL